MAFARPDYPRRDQATRRKLAELLRAQLRTLRKRVLDQRQRDLIGAADAELIRQFRLDSRPR